MSESILNALVHLFALVASVNSEGLSKKGLALVKNYLKRYLNNELIQEYLDLFNNYYTFYFQELKQTEDRDNSEQKSLPGFQAINVCRQIRRELKHLDRIIVLVQLLEFVNEDEIVTAEESEIIRIVKETFHLSPLEADNIIRFVLGREEKLIPGDLLLKIDNKAREWSESMTWFMKHKEAKPNDQKYIYRENLYGTLQFLLIPGIRSFIYKYEGEQRFYMEGHKVTPGRIYFFQPGSILRCPNITPIYFNEISIRFFSGDKSPVISFTGENLFFRFRGSQNGVQTFNFNELSGNLVGILGGSGVGKSTLLSLINGKLRPDKGTIKINGYEIYKYRFHLQGMIGFVPQDDMLFEDLTVYQNLYYNARLCFGDQSKEEIQKRVNKTLKDLDLEDVSHLKVGNPLNKFISGGQRKRLNIGLELMREPYILILDEPTSGLSSSDSENIVRLLKEQTLEGKLVFATIHQPSSEIFKIFDQLWVLDKGGYPVYSGNPIDAIIYFKRIGAQVNAVESECPTCGNVDTDQILNILGEKTLDAEGNPTSERKITPQKWHQYFKENIESKLVKPSPPREIPEINYKIPPSRRQFSTFSIRNLLSKITNSQYLIINLLEAPLLALILGFFTKYINGQEYIFRDNKNLTAYLFMSIVVSFFMGLVVSAEEIVKDRKILERESFLNLSWPAYVNSKILFLFALSAFQTLTFVLVGNLILHIQGMLFIYWLILFSTAAIGNLIGLNISSGLDSVISIYILIPLILVPQLLLGGAMIRFDDLNKHLTNPKYVPIIGDLMITRWAYEAIMVAQFKTNAFEKHFYDDEQVISTANYHSTFLIPELEKKLRQCQIFLEDTNSKENQLHNDLMVVQNALKKMVKFQNMPPFELTEKLNSDSVSNDVLEETMGYLSYLKILFSDKESEADNNRDHLYQELETKIGHDSLRHLQEENYNNKLADLVMNRLELQKTVEYKNQIIRKMDPVFTMPENKFGRAQFYAPYKLFVNQRIDTLWFNLVVIWLGTLTFYFMLLTEILRKVITYFSELRFSRRQKNK